MPAVFSAEKEVCKVRCQHWEGDRRRAAADWGDHRAACRSRWCCCIACLWSSVMKLHKKENDIWI
ncbi:hypothetical protein LINPERPRIM_LOCUS13582 [Linum perenne]